MYAGGVTKGRLLHIQNVSTGLTFLVDSGAQISLLPATNSYRFRGSDKLTLQAVNKSVIKTYGQKLMTLDLGVKTRIRLVLCYCRYRQTDFRC